MNYPAPIPESKEDKTHGLLEQPSVAYSNVTVRRAFVVWMYCGQKNRFKDVCNYFHHLEALEEKLSSEYRASSRHHEFHLFSNPPPKSSYLMRNFPNLYSDTQIPKNENHSHDAKILRLGEFDRIAQRSGTSRSEIVEASKMIRSYCKTHMKTLERFLKEFREHTERCGLANTVGNVGSYIKRKIIQADIELEANYATTLEIMKRNDYINNSADELNKFEVQCNADRKLVARSGRNDSRSIAKVQLVNESQQCSNTFREVRACATCVAFRQTSEDKMAVTASAYSTPVNTVDRENLITLIRNNILNNSVEFIADTDLVDTDSPIRKPKSLQPVIKKLFHSPMSDYSPKEARKRLVSRDEVDRGKRALKRRQILIPDTSEKIKKAYVKERDGDSYSPEPCGGMRQRVLISLFHNKEYSMDCGD
ncbi:unnamed protein product, partial [Iphiclides podalirius]